MKRGTNDIKKIMFVTIFADLLFMSILCVQGIYKEPDITNDVITESETIDSLIGTETEDGTEQKVGVSIIAAEETDLLRDYSGDRDKSMEEIFGNLIIGNYKSNSNTQYNFGLSGIYSGFFDDANTDVSGYSYEIVAINEKMLLNIYNKEKTAAVSYELVLSGKSKIILYYRTANLEIVLESEN